MEQNEIDFFDRLSTTWDDNEVLSTPDKVNEMLDAMTIGKGMRVLDLGTGTGVLIPYLNERTGSDGAITAVDMSEGMLTRARAKYGQLPNVRFEKLDFERDDVDGRYDVIILYSVYPHLRRPMETLGRLLRDNVVAGGRIIVAFPTDEMFINSIHHERKAESDLLPPAPTLAQRFADHGFDARVVAYDPGHYIVEVTGRQ